jgi:hypothetical protein
MARFPAGSQIVLPAGSAVPICRFGVGSTTCLPTRNIKAPTHPSSGPGGVRELNAQPALPKADFLWMPTCSKPDTSQPPVDAQDIDRGNIGFWRSCWRRRGGSWGSGNSWGNDLFVVRWVGELYPRWPGVATYNLNTDDGGRIIIRRNPAYRLGEGEPTPFFQVFTSTQATPSGHDTRRNPENDAVGVEAWRDSDNNQVSFRLELQCADPERPSPYLVEIQAYENEGNAFVRLTTQGDGHPLENYDLRYLKPCSQSTSHASRILRCSLSLTRRIARPASPSGIPPAGPISVSL